MDLLTHCLFLYFSRPDLIVNIENETYDIKENEGPLEVCATLSNPASEDVTVTAIARESDSPDARGTISGHFVLLIKKIIKKIIQLNYSPLNSF